MSTKQPIWPSGRFGVPQITPFTYRDGHTHMELIEALREHLVERLHPSLVSTVNSLVEQMEAEYGKALDQYVNGVEEFQRIHDAFMADVNAHLIALNDGAVSDLVDDDTSLLYRVLDREFTTRERFEQAVVDAADFGAVPGSPDSTQGIQDAIDYAHENNTSRVMVVGEHNIQAHITGDTSGGVPYFWDAPEYEGGIRLRSGVTLDLSHATLRVIPNSAQHYSLLRIVDCHNSSVIGGTLIGDRYDHIGTSGEWGMGVFMMNSRNIRVENMHISDMWADGVYVAASVSSGGHYNEDVTFHDVHCDNNRRQGMSIIGGRNIHTTSSTFTNTHGILPMSGVDIEPNSDNNVCENISFRDCEFRGNQVYGFTASRPNVQNVTIDSCVIADNHVEATGNGQLRFVEGPENIRILNTTIRDSHSTTALELRARNALVTGCDIDGRVSITAHDSEQNKTVLANNVLGNNFTIAGGNVMVDVLNNKIFTMTSANNHMYRPEDITLRVEGNVFSSTEYSPIRAGSMSHSHFHIANNIFEGYSGNAVLLQSTNTIQVNGNTFHQDDGSGPSIFIYGESRNIHIQGNTVTNGELVTFNRAISHARVVQNISPTVVGSYPRTGSVDVLIELSPISWWFDRDIFDVGTV